MFGDVVIATYMYVMLIYSPENRLQIKCMV